jgi:hypothetical protein
MLILTSQRKLHITGAGQFLLFTFRDKYLRMEATPKRTRRSASFLMLAGGLVLVLFTGTALMKGLDFFYDEDGGLSWTKCAWPVIGLLQIVGGYLQYQNAGEDSKPKG